MNDSPEISLKQQFAILNRGKYIAGAIALTSVILSLAYFITAPRVFQAQGLVCVPESNRLLAVSSETNGATFVMVNVGGKSKPTAISLINVSETKALLNSLQLSLKKGENIGQFSQKSRENMKSIWLEEIKGSDNYFRLTIQTKGSAEIAREALLGFIMLLRENDHIKSKLNNELEGLNKSLKETEASIQRTDSLSKQIAALLKSNRYPPFNPAELEVNSNELKIKSNNILVNLKSTKNYEIVNEPVALPSPVSPKLIPVLSLGAVLGLMLGILTVFVRAFIRRIN